MKKITSLISAAACITALSGASIPANAEDSNKIYGTMNIPYADFYAAEIENEYQVDAVSSATEKKWSMNESGQLVAGTFNDNNGTILGVTFPVEVNTSDIYKLEKYNFIQLDSKPTAYKKVSISNDSLTVSKLIDTNGKQNVNGSAELSTSTRYGDYQLNVKGYPEETDLYGVIVNTREGNKYALRHLENIWRSGQLSWSAGIITKEGHGNELKYDNYASSMGKTVTTVTFITLDGYTTVDVGENYLPVKFSGEVKAEDSVAGNGKSSLTLTGFPDDYIKEIIVGDNFSVSENEILYNNAMPGKYTISVSDKNGKYASLSGDFLLTSDDIPVKYADEKLVKAENFSDDSASNFIKNITSIEVNENKFSTSGKGAVKVFDENGDIDFNAESRNGKVFNGGGNYSITITATGYTKPYSFEIKSDETTVTSTSATNAKITGTSAATTSSFKNNSPKTGVAGVAIPAAFLMIAASTAFAVRKKKS